MIERLDQALGAAPEPIVAYRPAPDIAAECLLEYPIQRREAVEQALGPLIEQAAAALAAGGQGALQLQCELSCETGERLPLVLALFEASAAPRRWFELAKLQLEQVRLPEPISAVRLSVLSAAPLVARQQELFADERPYSSDSDRRQLALSIDRLSSRLRREAVSRAVLTPDAQPEYAYRYEPLTGVGPRRKPASKTASTVHDLVAFARSQNILCQGRGSAANSAVCYCLKITAVNPNEMEMLFERFISRERKEAPDIDVDFEHERREEVIQYLYDKYGRQRAGMTAEVITYRPRSAVRDVGKTLGLSLDRIDKLAKTLEHHSLDQLEPCCRMAGIDPASRVGQQLVTLTGQLVGFPRHLGQHVGGMVMTRGPLCELVPIENALMPDRTVIEWDKNDLDELGMLKVDCLALGMLTAIHRSFDLIERHTGRRLTLASIPVDDPPVYEMIRRADTLGVFQIESRAQMSMLPRLKPERFYDLVIEIAIVRPGPIQGNMVHPYLRRRSGEEPVEYPSDAIRSVLEKTLGVPLFQEQAMRLAMVAGFSASEADQLRRAVSGWRSSGPSARAAPK